MFSFSKDDVKPEHMDIAYKHLKEYCDTKGVDVLEFVRNKDNIPEAAKAINKEIPWLMRKIFTVPKLESMLTENIDFIIAQAETRHGNDSSKPSKGMKA